MKGHSLVKQYNKIINREGAATRNSFTVVEHPFLDRYDDSFIEIHKPGLWKLVLGDNFNTDNCDDSKCKECKNKCRLISEYNGNFSVCTDIMRLTTGN